jgi:uncharacterized membrane protein
MLWSQFWQGMQPISCLCHICLPVHGISHFGWMLGYFCFCLAVFGVVKMFASKPSNDS